MSRRRWSGCGMASFVAPRASALTRRLRAPVGTATTIRELPESSKYSAKRRRSVSGDPPTAKQQPQRGRVVGVVHVAVEGLAGALQPLAQRVAVDSECPGSLLPLATVHGGVRTLRKVNDAGPQVQPRLESASVRPRLSSSARADGTHSPYRRGGRQRWADGTQRRRLQPLGHLHPPRTSSTCTTGSADTHCSLGRNRVMKVAITVMVGHEFLRWPSAPCPTATAAPLSITGPGVYSADALPRHRQSAGLDGSPRQCALPADDVCRPGRHHDDDQNRPSRPPLGSCSRRAPSICQRYFRRVGNDASGVRPPPPW